MKILSRHVARDFLRYWLLCLTALVLLVFIASLFGNIDAAFSSWRAFGGMLRETASHLPTTLEYMLPVTVLLATVLTLSALSRTSELLAMKAAGFGTVRLLVPLWVLAVPIATLVYVNQHHLHPLLATGQDNARQTVAREQWLGRGDSLYYVGRADPGSGTVRDVRAFHVAPGAARLDALEHAAAGRRDDGRWRFRDVVVRRVHTGIWSMVRLETREVPVASFPDLFRATELDAHHMPFFDLYGKIRQLERTRQRALPYRVEWYQKTAAMAAPFLMVLLGSPLARVHGRRGGKVFAMAATIIAALAYVILSEILLILGKGGYLPPPAAAWSLNAIYLVAGVLLVRNAR